MSTWNRISKRRSFPPNTRRRRKSPAPWAASAVEAVRASARRPVPGVPEAAAGLVGGGWVAAGWAGGVGFGGGGLGGGGGVGGEHGGAGGLGGDCGGPPSNFFQ